MDLGASSGVQGVRLRASNLFMACGVLLAMPYTSLLAYTADAVRVAEEAADGCVLRRAHSSHVLTDLHWLCKKVVPP